MDTSQSQKRLYQRRQFKRRPLATQATATVATGSRSGAQPMAVQVIRGGSGGGGECQQQRKSQRRRRRNRLYQDFEECAMRHTGKRLALNNCGATALDYVSGDEDEAENIDGLRFHGEDDDYYDEELDDEDLDEMQLAFIESSPPKVEDEMIFELQQVDQVDDTTIGKLVQLPGKTTSTINGGAVVATATTNTTTAVNAVAAKCTETAKSASQGHQLNESSHKLETDAPAKQCNSTDTTASRVVKSPEARESCDNQLEFKSSSLANDDKSDEQLEPETAQKNSSVMNLIEQQQLQLKHPTTATVNANSTTTEPTSATTPSTTTTTTLNLCEAKRQLQQLQLRRQQHHQPAQQQQQGQHRFRMANHHPVKTRTIFSCMWPSCTKNYDQLDDIERHVRAHLGPKQCEAIGDEDFYYEETEVDEATYLAIFNTRNHLPLSPSHNSDGLSSGQSFASSSPATSPVCSTDSSSSSSTSSSASNSAASSAASTLSDQASQLYANSIDWKHFLADHTHMLRQSPASLAGKWLPPTAHAGYLTSTGAPSQAKHMSGKLLIGPNSPMQQYGSQHHQQALVYRASELASYGITKQKTKQNNFRHNNHNNNIDNQPTSYKTSLSTNYQQINARNSIHLRANGANAKRRNYANHSPINTATYPNKKFSSSSSATKLLHHQQPSAAATATTIATLNGFSSTPITSSSSSSIVAPSSTCNGAQLQFSMQLATTPHGADTKRRRQTGSAPVDDHTYNSSLPVDGTSKGNKITGKRGAKRQHRASAATTSGHSKQASTNNQQQHTNHLKKHNGHPSHQFFHNQSTSSHNNNNNNKQSLTYNNNSINGNSISNNGDYDDLNHDDHRTLSSSQKMLKLKMQQTQQSTLEALSQPEVGGSSSSSSTGGRRVRGENRKCRKVYGMERRDMWCTQCKWKKACSRFCDQQ